MKRQAELPRSNIACVSKRDGTVLRVGADSRLIGPVVVDPLHVMLGAGVDDWGVCIYLTMPDAARLKVALDLLITEHAERGSS